MIRLSELEAKIEGQAPKKSAARQISDFYFEPKSFEKNGKLYEQLGVKQFKKKLIQALDIIHGKENNYYRRRYNEVRSKPTLLSLSGGMRCAELLHLALEFVFAYAALDYADKGDYFYASLSGAAGIVNTYLLILQRYNRFRVYDLIDKMKQIER
ncbi:hypothetical protein HYS31_00940 [Candidatus Woesearchaeota archaeon]|nr:hypothetical protein [Candidatus Woesearchaeota archaeon]